MVICFVRVINKLTVFVSIFTTSYTANAMAIKRLLYIKLVRKYGKYAYKKNCFYLFIGRCPEIYKLLVHLTYKKDSPYGLS